MTPNVPHLNLNDGSSLPQMGFGLWQVPADRTADLIVQATRLGYRQFDGAALYGNEEGLGEGVRRCGLPREEVFVTTKIWNDRHGFDNTLRAAEESFGRLGLDRLDLLLIHWPAPARNLYLETWKALIRLREEGRVTSIGVSNFAPEHLDRIVGETGVVPVLNQIELHPWMQQHELRAYHQAHGIVTEAWSPLGQGKLLDEPVLAEIGGRHGRSPAQVVLRWHLDLGHVVIPKSSNPDRIRQNLDVLDFTLTEDEHVRLAAMNRDQRIGTHPDTPPTNGLPAGH